MAKPTASFNASDLATVVPGLMITGHTAYRPGNRKLNTAKIANTDKSAMPSAYFDDKKLNVQVEIGRDTRELLDAAMDILLGILLPTQSTLLLGNGTSTRQWTATYSNMAISNVKGGHAEIDIEFEAADGIGIDTASTSLFSTQLTGNNTNTPFIGIIGGSMPWQQPIITITLNSFTGSTSDSITVGNPLNGMQVVIARAWAAADVLVIDSKLKKVTVNGVEVAFTGSIPEWQSGIAGSMDYTDTFTVRNRTMSGIYYKRYA